MLKGSIKAINGSRSTKKCEDGSVQGGAAPVKIVRIITRLNIGGPTLHAVLLTERLNNTACRSILVTGRVGKSEGDMLYYAHQHGVTPITVPELGREISWWDDLVALWKLYRLCRKERPDIVHTHTAKAGTLGRIAAVLAGVPIRIHTFHGHVFHDYFGRFKTGLFLFIERALALVTTRLIVISSSQLGDLSSRYRIAPREKFRLIPLGLDLSPFLQQVPLRERSQETSGVLEAAIGFIGRLVPVKNPRLAVQVIEELTRRRRADRPVRLIIVGDGELKPDLQEDVRRKGLDGCVLFAGWKTDLTQVYAGLDLVILTSLNEGTPVALIEAMASGLPFVSTRIGGVSDLMVGPTELIRDPDGRPLFSVFANGILVEPGEVEGFVAAVEYLLDRPTRMKQMGAAGRDFAKERFSKERLVSETERLYLECLSAASLE